MSNQNMEYEAFTILNASGDIWTQGSFGSEGAAQHYLDKFSKRHRNADMSKHRIVPAVFTVTPIKGA